jgi:benzodiazapine receptor
MEQKDWIALVVIVVSVGLAAGVGSLTAIDAVEQYGELEQPAWAPPSWLFGPVWFALYIAIAVAGFLVWREQGWAIDGKLWVGQLVLNGLWTPFFFALEWRLFALLVILALDAVAITFLVRQWPRWPARLFVPYIAWICFATALNAAVWRLN